MNDNDGSARVVPGPATTAVLIKRAAFYQRPEMLLERVAAGAGQFDGRTDSHATLLAGKLDDL
jgi:hypothetical protein|nr:hypothetical protein [Acidiferrobacter sp. SPIII_3]